jgi:hypothetical protein
MLAASLKPPTREEVRKLTMLDIAIMNGLADSFRNTLKKYIQIDPYTMPDPFGSEDEYNYSVILDRQEPRRVVAMIASKLESLPQLPWDDILADRFMRLSLSRTDANAIKNELMPKDTNNFYQYRRSGKINGYIMFAFQVCGQR